MTLIEALGIGRKPRTDRVAEAAGPAVAQPEATPASAVHEEITARLMEQIADRDIEINQLKVAVATAEAASAAKLQFLANMSHELRTPLNAIVGYALLLHEDATASGRKESVDDLDRIIRAARHLVGLINDILDISKIEAGRIELEYGVVDIDGLVSETMVALGPSKNPNVLFKVVVPEDAGYISSDATKLRQCLLNLLSNAAKFTEHGAITLTVRIEDGGGHDSVVFEVKDTGIGMTPAEVARLFETFVQADATTTRKYGGSGLGLAITRRLARLMGGDVSVKSEQGVGSTFTLSVPRELAGVPAARPQAEAPQHAPQRKANGHKVALVIEDDKSASDLVKRWLAKAAYEIVSSGDAAEGFALAQEKRPDLILLDLELSNGTGWDVLSRLRGDPELNQIPVILTTVDDDRRRGLVAGASEHLTKPLTQEKLLHALQTYDAPVTGEILVIDDDPDAVDLIARSAAHIGLSVRRAFNGAEGLAAARAQPPGAIVMDLSMPGMSGFDLLEALAGDPQLKHVPVIVLSGQSLSLSEHEALMRAGASLHAKGISSPREIMAELKKKIAS
jgi:signal transduction histidine kinase/CheY-like chemotaxis protein